MADVAFDFKKFIDETKATILTPADYFSVMAKTGGFDEPLIKALIYSTIAALINMIWYYLNMGIIGGLFSGMLGGGIGVVGFMISIITSIVGLFIGGAIVLVISAICEGNTDYEANLRVTASMMVLSPIGALFNFVYRLSTPLGSIVSIAIILYGFWMLYNAITNSLSGKEITAKIISIILSTIPVLVVLSSLICSQIFSNAFNHNMNTIPDQMMKNIPTEDQEQMKKALEEATKGLEQMNKELQEEGKEAQK